MSEVEMRALVDSFDRCTLPREQWNHRAHLVYALVKLLDDEDGGEAIRAGILRYAAAQGIAQTLEGGYHESITRFYIAIVRRFIAETDVNRPLPVLVEELMNRFGDRQLPFQYYSKQRLMSWQARTEWVEPDLQPLNPYESLDSRSRSA